VVPFHPLRHLTRALTARVGAALALFLAIAAVLLAGGWNGVMANGGPDQGDTAAGAQQTQGTSSGEEPVLGPDWSDSGSQTQQSEHQSWGGSEQHSWDSSEGHSWDGSEVQPSGSDSPSDGSDSPGNGSDSPSNGSDSPSNGSDSPTGGDAQPSSASGESSSGGDKGGGDSPSSPGPTSRSRVSPSGGSKDEDEPTTNPDTEPGPSSRTQTSSGSGSSPSDDGTSSQSQSTPQSEGPPGVGIGSLADLTGAGNAATSADHSARFGEAAGNGGAQSGGGGGGGGGGAGTLAGAAGGGGTLLAQAGTSTDQPTGGGGGGGKKNANGGQSGNDKPNVVTRTVDRIDQVVPDSVKAALAALAALSVLLGVGYLLVAMRARRLARQRRELLQEVGLLQTALLPPVPERVGSLRTSVAYRPADGPGAGGDFYDVLPLAGGRVGFILGDVSGHGRGALARTAFMRYTLRAYLEAGLEPRVALQVAGRVIDDNLGGDFATVLLAVHDPETGSLTYATAGHPAPIVVGPEPHDPVTAASSPPIGVGVRTGLRQTTVPLVPGSVAVLFTDGLMEARTEDGILGRERLTDIVEAVADSGSARKLLERVATEADARSDDMAAVVVSPTAGVTSGVFRTEQLELSSRELEGPIARRFLEACGFSEEEVDTAERDARMLAERFGGVVMHVVFGNRLRVEVLPRNVESIEAASRRVTAGTPQ
jgi:hypothetical protein